MLNAAVICSEMQPRDLSGTSEHILQDCNVLIITLEKTSIRGCCFAGIMKKESNNLKVRPNDLLRFLPT